MISLSDTASQVLAQQLPLLENDETTLAVTKADTHKQQSLKNAVSLQFNPADTAKKDALEMLKCSERITIKNGSIISHSRCKKRLCVTCASIRATEWKKRITKSFDYLDINMVDENNDESLPTAYGLALTLNLGETRQISELRESILLLHKLFPRLLKISALKNVVVGSLRSTELTVQEQEDGELHCNPHIHALLLIKGDPTDTDEVGHNIKRYWTKAVKTAVFRTFKHRVTAIPQAQEVKPLFKQDRQNYERWLGYCTKQTVADLAKKLEESPISTKSHIELCTQIDESIRGVKMIATTGMIKTAIADAKDELDQDKSNDPKSSTAPTHRWSFLLDKYLPLGDWSIEHKRPSDYLSRKMPYYSTPWHYPSTMIELEDNFHKDKQADEKAIMRHYALTGQVLKRGKGHLSEFKEFS